MQLAPFAIKAGIGIGGSLLAGKLGKSSPSGPEKTVLDAQGNQIRQAQSLYNNLTPQGESLIRTGSGAYNPVIDYWGSILRGNRGQVTSMMAPELNRINEGYDAATRSASELMPRGGGRATLMQDLPYQRMRDQQSLIQTARPAAAQGLLTAGKTAADTGSNLIQNAISGMQGATSAGRSILDYYAQKRAADTEMGGKMGAGLFNMLKDLDLSKVDFSKIFGGKGGSAPAGDYSRIPVPGALPGIGGG